MKKLVDGKYVDMTSEEIEVRNAEVKNAMYRELIQFVSEYRKQCCDGAADFMGITVNGDKKTRSAISETIQFWQELDPGSAPETIDWEGPDSFHQISLSTLIGLGKAIGFKRQKSFSVKRVVLDKIQAGEITTIEEAKVTFDAGMNS